MNASRHLAFASILVAAAFAAPGHVAANAYVSASAGVACQPASGALAAKVNYNLQFLTNVGTTDLTVVCHVPKTDADYYTFNFTSLSVAVFLPTNGSTVTCLAQTGNFRESGNYIKTSSAKSYTATAANQYAFVSWSSIDLTRAYTTDVLVLNCKLPPGARMGTIERVDADTSGPA